MRNNLTEGYFGDEITRYGFISHMKSFIRQLLTDPTKAQIDDYLQKHGLTNEKAVEILIKSPKGDKNKGPVLYRKETIKKGNDGKDVFCVKYQLPREGFKYRRGLPHKRNRLWRCAAGWRRRFRGWRILKRS